MVGGNRFDKTHASIKQEHGKLSDETENLNRIAVRVIKDSERLASDVIGVPIGLWNIYPREGDAFKRFMPPELTPYL